ncbi:hypothetical protein BBP40_006991, partial [Aspergillus hancockii]
MTSASLDKTAEGDLPAYDQVDQPQLVIPPLDLRNTAGLSACSTVTQDQCIAHLKFLAALADLRDSVTNIDGLFNIKDPDPAVFGDDMNEAFARVKEKRWAVYTARAVDRYSTWWKQCVYSSYFCRKLSELRVHSYNSVTECLPHKWSQGEMPPLDILMVLHAHMLNPRAYLEDCIRNVAMNRWAAGLPWELIDSCINTQTMEYDAGQTAEARFQQVTGLPWDNLQGASEKSLECPKCEHQMSVPWTDAQVSLPLNEAFEHCHGFADKNFEKNCPVCKFSITHDVLRVQKFRKDVKSLLLSELPMPGTFYDLMGVPKAILSTDRRKRQLSFPNRLIQAIGPSLLRETSPKDNGNSCTTVKALCVMLQLKMKDRGIMRTVNPDSAQISLYPVEKVVFRRMMARYWDNSSPFALDLVGAVIRQGTFVQKMDNIDWLHSPEVKATMGRLINKYEVFFQIMARNPRHMAVPTLDVDLAWHTHQLSPSRYFNYSTVTTHQQGKNSIFIDHDDKVEENKLSDGFEWTSRVYKKITNGEVYSECTCWYCEAIRASDLRDGIFVSQSTSKAREAAANLHNRPDISSHPDKNPHISAHNAVPAQVAKSDSSPDPRHI